jgi:large repetitive protein
MLPTGPRVRQQRRESAARHRIRQTGVPALHAFFIPLLALSTIVASATLELHPVAAEPQRTAQPTFWPFAAQRVARELGGSLQVSAPNASHNPVDANSTLTLSTNVTGGQPPYTFLWGGLPTGCGGENNSTLSCIPTTAETTSIWVNITDANETNATSPNMSLRVATELSAYPGVDPSAGAAPLRVMFSSIITGGVRPYTTTWDFGGGNFSSAANTTHAYDQTGVFPFSFWENDSGGGAFNWSYNITVTPHPLLEANLTPSSIDLGQSVNFSINVSGGTGEYALSWSGLPPQCTTSNSTRLAECTPSTVAVYNVGVLVRDSADDLQDDSETFSVLSDPSIGAPALIPKAVDAGENVELTVSAHGGTGVYTILWSGLPAGCSSENLSTLNCTPATSGSYNVSVSVLDTDGFRVSSNHTTLVVSPRLVVTAVTVNRSRVEVAQSIHVSTSGTGGFPPYSYAWAGLPSGCSAANLPLLACSPAEPGTYTITVNVSDANRNSILSAGATLEVIPTVSVIAAAFSEPVVVVGSESYLNVSIRGGASPFLVVFTGLPPGCATENTTNLTCLPTAPGSFVVTVKVTDSLGGTGNGSAELTVSSEGAGATNGPQPIEYAVVAVAATVALAALFIVQRSRKRNRNSGS